MIRENFVAMNKIFDEHDSKITKELESLAEALKNYGFLGEVSVNLSLTIFDKTTGQKEVSVSGGASLTFSR
jgi:hypothetical protein